MRTGVDKSEIKRGNENEDGQENEKNAYLYT